MALTIKEEIKSPWIIIHLGGKLDVVTSPQLDEALYKCFQDSKADIVVEFSNLNYLSSSGIRVLLSQHRKFTEQKRRFILMALPSHIKEIIRLAGFDKVFTLVEELKEIHQ